MVTHLTRREPNRAARRAGPRHLPALPLAAAALAGGALVSPPADAAKLCGERERIVQRLEQRHEETPQALGLSADGGVLEVLVAPDGGWTILVTYPKRPTCIVAIGKAWQILQLAGGQGA